MLPHPFADRLDARDVFIDLAMHLDLEITVALVGKLAGLARHLVGRLDGHDAQDRDGAAHLAAEKIVERHAERAGGEIVQRAVNCGFGLMRA